MPFRHTLRPSFTVMLAFRNFVDLLRLFNTISFALAGLLCLLTGTLSAQQHEIGAWGGMGHSFGDINNSRESLQFAEPAFGFFYRHNFNTRASWYLGAAFGSTYGEDAISDDIYQQTRNLSFRSDLWEVATRFELNFFPLSRTKDDEWFTPFVFAGLSLYHFNPQALYDGNWVDLQPLGTEGQNVEELSGNDPYYRYQVAIPLGGGVKFAVSKNITMGLEVNWHKLFTDYLDDVSTVFMDPAILATTDQGALAIALADRSAELEDIISLGRAGQQRGDRYRDDAFVFAGIFLSYSIVNMKCPMPGGGKGF
jgi:opacity protein-like surface antigen